jgi:hypothetical protein
MICDVCGAALPPRLPGRRGAPVRLCSAECRRWSKRLSELQGLADVLIRRSSSATRDRCVWRLRRDLTSVRNIATSLDRELVDSDVDQ